MLAESVQPAPSASPVSRAQPGESFLVRGILYAVLWLYGLLIDHGGAANFVPVNSAENWLHLVVGSGWSP